MNKLSINERSLSALSEIALISTVFSNRDFTVLTVSGNSVKSSLFTIATVVLPISASRSISLESSSVIGREPSKTAITSSAPSICLRERSTPIFSTGSSVLLSPAVSVSRSVAVPSDIRSVRTSRVVPAISVTIALSSPTRRL